MRFRSRLRAIDDDGEGDQRAERAAEAAGKKSQK